MGDVQRLELVVARGQLPPLDLEGEGNVRLHPLLVGHRVRGTSRRRAHEEDGPGGCDDASQHATPFLSSLPAAPIGSPWLHLGLA